MFSLFRAVPLFVATALVVTGAVYASGQASDGNAAFMPSNWTLAELNGTPAAAGVETTLVFGEANGIGGNGGCNVYGGSVSFGDDGEIEISEVFSTMMACEDPKLGQEQAYFAALETVAHYTLAEGRLSLLDAEGNAVVVLERAR